MRRKFGRPLCHPDRKHLAHGLCHQCYLRNWKATQRRPSRTNSVLDQRAPLDPLYMLPIRTPQHRYVATTFPLPSCPKCNSTLLRYVGREARCFTCGHDVWLVRAPQAAAQPA